MRAISISVLLLIAPFLALPAVPATAGTDGELWEAWYSVRASARSPRLDAELAAGGRLALAGRRQASGALGLSLRRVLEHPWKLYRVDPVGPFGEELKVASVITLPEASWEALAAAEAASRADGFEHHRRWLETADRPRELDGTFAFVVIGAERDRFRIEIGPEGTVSNVSNTLTDRWLSGPFDRFIGTWGTEGRRPSPGAEPAPEGYWFWNRGEGEPFAYEPHTYEAFAAALELLSFALPPCCSDSAVREGTLTWDGVALRAMRVLSVLAPRLSSASPAEALAAPTPLSFADEILADGNRRLILSSGNDSPQLWVQRQTVISRPGHPMSDRIRIRFSASAGSSLEVEAGYRPLEAREELK